MRSKFIHHKIYRIVHQPFSGVFMSLTTRTKFLLIACSFICIHMQIISEAQSVCMETIGSMHLQSFGLTSTQTTSQVEIKDPKKALTLSLSEAEQRRLVYKLCAQQEKKSGINPTTDDESLKNLLTDLEIFVSKGEHPEETVFNRTIGSYTHTIFGQAMAAKMLATIEPSSTKLLERQVFINELATNDQLFNEVDTIMQTLKGSEAKLLSFWQEEPKLAKKLISQLFFNKSPLKRFNKNAILLETLTRLDNLKTVYNSTVIFTTLIFSNYFGSKMASKMSHNAIPSISLLEATKNALQMYNPWNSITAIRSVRSGEFVEKNVEAFKLQHGSEPSDADIAMIRKMGKAACGISALTNAYLLYNAESSIKNGINHTLLVRDTANFMQERLIGVATHLRALDKIDALAKQNPSLYLGVPGLKETELLFSATTHDDLHQLVQLLVTKTFTGKASFFSITGRVLAAYTLMQEQKDNLIKEVMILGEIDACFAAAKLYRESQNNRVVYSFAQYQDSETPHIKVTDFWNPLVDKSVVVTNSMELGKPLVERNMILTGSNTGGKSTMLKAMALNVLMAQTLTIVPAKAYESTPFAYLATYMNINDDTATGNSLFKAEVLRTKKLVEAAAMLTGKNFGFVVIDELFTGTDADKAAEGAYKVAYHLSQSPNTCFILATHFTKTIPALEVDTNGICRNFKIDADKDTDGTIKRSFKIEPGISSNNIALTILHDELTDIDF